MSSGRVISMKKTRSFKYGFCGGAAGLVVLVTAINWRPGGGVATNIVPTFILAGFWLYFLRRGGVFKVADEVVECGDHLAVRMGGKQVTVRYSNIAGAETVALPGFGGVRVNFAQRIELGKLVTFWVESKADGEMIRVATDISERAIRAREGRSG